MNGLEQTQRFTAVARVEKRLDDVELLLHELAIELAKEQRANVARMQNIASLIATREQEATEHARRLAQLSDLLDAETDARRAFEHQTLRQRVRWAVGL